MRRGPIVVACNLATTRRRVPIDADTLITSDPDSSVGDLAPEALVLRIEALARTGERDAAEDLARDYLAKNPSSPHAERIRTLLGWDGEKR